VALPAAAEVEEKDGDAWVLPVTELREVEEKKVREQMHRDRRAEYLELRAEADAFLDRAREHPAPQRDHAARLRAEKELVALQRRFRKIRARDYFDGPGRTEVALTIDRCLLFRQGISSKLSPVTDYG
jgi:hypothetical protein